MRYLASLRTVNCLSSVAPAVAIIRTARIIRGTKSGSVSKVSRYLELPYDQALRLVTPLVWLGILAQPDSSGFRALRTGALPRSLLFIIALGGRTQARRSKPDWHSIKSYAELDRIAARCHWLEPQAFLHGPIARFFALATEPGLPARAGARILECARNRAAEFAVTLEGEHSSRDAFEQAALASAQQRLGSSRHGQYLIDVFAGRANHNSAGD